MAIKAHPLVFCIYGAMLLYALAGALFWCRRGRAGWIVFGAGFVLLGGAVAWRAVEVGRVPIQTMFEVFLFLGFLAFPLAFFSCRVLRLGRLWLDALLGIFLLFPAAFLEKFSVTSQPLMPALQSGLFAPHVLAYMLGYAFYLKAAVWAAPLVWRWEPESPRAMDVLVRVGFPFLTLGLILGCVWAKQLGEWWNWDPKEMWSLATWLMVTLYFHWPRRRVRLRAATVLAVLALILITLLWANLSRLFQGYHTYAA